jgi:GWxTD domain-containing protein
MKKVYGVFFLIMLCCSVLWGQQRLVPSSGLVLNLDYARFRNNDTTAYLEIYYGFYPALACYELRDGRYAGLLKVVTGIKDNSTGSYVVHNRSDVPLSISDTTDRALHSTVISEAGYALPFGDYTLEALVFDSLDPGRRDSISLPLSLKGYDPDVAASDLELCSSVKTSEKKGNLFYKNSLEVMPNPTLVFGVASYPMMFNYVEMYNLDPEQTYTVKTQVVGGDGKVVKEASKNRKYGVKDAVEAGATNVASIPSGKYRFRILLSDTEGSPIAENQKTFFIYNPHLKAANVRSTSMSAAELAGLSADELEKEFREVQYLATDQEVKMFSQITSAEGRREFLAKFWSEVQSGRGGQPGITRSAYLQRVAVANQRFHALGRPGWNTDRGRVFLVYGEPDEIERYPSSVDAKPYEVWHYYSIENGVEFDFVERTGFGDYILVNSTKRGELQDSQWQRYLQ